MHNLSQQTIAYDDGPCALFSHDIELAQRLWPVYHFYTAAHAYTMQVIL